MHSIALGAKAMASRKENTTVGTSTPVTIGLAVALLTAIGGFGIKAGAIQRDVESVAIRLTNVENREQNAAKNNVDLVTKLTRIEVLLEGATAAIARLEREQKR